MTKGIFTTKVNPTYDDLPEIYYHFPKTYLKQAQATVGDWIIYYEPRRQDIELSSRGGRQAYFATARVQQIVTDSHLPGHYYALVTDFLEFNHPVAFRQNGTYVERALMKEDGSTNKGAFGRSIRLLSETEYQLIVQLGFAGTSASQMQEAGTMVTEEPEEYVRPLMKQLLLRPFRETAFSQNVRTNYDFTCAMTSLRIINGGGHPEVEAAHIRPVGHDHHGPDSIRNGIALSRSVHWMFDRGLLSLTDDYKILMVKQLIPEPIKRLFNQDGKIMLPLDTRHHPHLQ